MRFFTRSARPVRKNHTVEQSKNAVLHSLGAASSQESYGHAIDEFIGWYCSEPRLAFNRTVVLRYRFFLEQKNLAPSTINVRLAAVRRLAYEASDTGLLSPDLAWLLTTCVAPVLGSAISQAENLSKFSFYLDTHRFRQRSAISAASRSSAKR